MCVNVLKPLSYLYTSDSFGTVSLKLKEIAPSSCGLQNFSFTHIAGKPGVCSCTWFWRRKSQVCLGILQNCFPSPLHWKPVARGTRKGQISLECLDRTRFVSLCVDPFLGTCANNNQEKCWCSPRWEMSPCTQKYTFDYSSMEFLFRCNSSQAQKSKTPERMASIPNPFCSNFL